MYLLLIIRLIKPNILFMRRCADGTVGNTNDLRMCVFVSCNACLFDGAMTFPINNLISDILGAYQAVFLEGYFGFLC